MLASIRHVLPLTTIRRQRLLPLPGRILVRKGQPVSAGEVVAEADLAPSHLLVDAARALGLTPVQVEAAMQRQPGDRVTAGDLIAGPVGWPKRVVRATQPGQIVQVRRGQVLIQLDGAPFQLRAGYPGTVSALIADRGVEITATGALVQGVWGNGGLDYGLLRLLARRPEDVLTADRLEIGLRGAVVLAGFCAEQSTLQAAAELPLRGLVLASMAASLIPQANSLPFPVVVLEGFGLLPMNPAALRLLTTSDQRELAVIAESAGRYDRARPEVFIPLPVSETPGEPRQATLFAPGQRVRLLRAPYSSQVGMLIAVRPEQELFPSGVRAQAASVRLENGREVVLPLANLEVLE
jgi:hypothetical protein